MTKKLEDNFSVSQKNANQPRPDISHGGGLATPEEIHGFRSNQNIEILPDNSLRFTNFLRLHARENQSLGFYNTLKALVLIVVIPASIIYLLDILITDRIFETLNYLGVTILVVVTIGKIFLAYILNDKTVSWKELIISSEGVEYISFKKGEIVTSPTVGSYVLYDGQKKKIKIPIEDIKNISLHPETRKIVLWSNTEVEKIPFTRSKRITVESRYRNINCVDVTVDTKFMTFNFPSCSATMRIESLIDPLFPTTQSSYRLKRRRIRRTLDLPWILGIVLFFL